MKIFNDNLVDSLLWFGIGAGIGFCLFFKPKRDKIDELLADLEDHLKVWENVPWEWKYPDRGVYFDHVHCTEGGQELSLPKIRLEHMDWRDLPDNVKWISVEEACRLAHLRFPNRPITPKEDAQYD